MPDDRDTLHQSDDATLVRYPADLVDSSAMYVLDALGASILVRERDDGLYVHIDTVDADRSRLRPGLPLIVEVNNGGENHYGGDDA